MNSIYEMGLDDNLNEFNEQELAERLAHVQSSLEAQESQYALIGKMRLNGVDEPFTEEEVALAENGYACDHRGWYNVHLPDVSLVELEISHLGQIGLLKHYLRKLTIALYKRKGLKITLPTLACEENADAASAPGLESSHVRP